jgi:hypothetical protein
LYAVFGTSVDGSDGSLGLQLAARLGFASLMQGFLRFDL